MKQQEFWRNISLIKPQEAVINLMKSAYRRMPMAVGTGASRQSAMLQLQELGIVHFFDSIVTADDVSSHKPEPDTFLQCAKHLNVEPTHCQVFEDGELGMMAARKAGMILTDVRPFVSDPFDGA